MSEVARNEVWNVDAQDVCGGSDHANIVEEVERAQATVIENSKILRGLWVKGW